MPCYLRVLLVFYFLFSVMNFKGVEKVQRVRLQTLRDDWEALRITTGESISDFCSRVRAIMNLMSLNRETFEEVRIVEKILRSLEARFDLVMIPLEEAKDVFVMSLEELMGALLAHEEKLARGGKSLSSMLFRQTCKSRTIQILNLLGVAKLVEDTLEAEEEMASVETEAGGSTAAEGPKETEVLILTLMIRMVMLFLLPVDQRLIRAGFNVTIVSALGIMVMNVRLTRTRFNVTIVNALGIMHINVIKADVLLVEECIDLIQRKMIVNKLCCLLIPEVSYPMINLCGVLTPMQVTTCVVFVSCSLIWMKLWEVLCLLMTCLR